MRIGVRTNQANLLTSIATNMKRRYETPIEIIQNAVDAIILKIFLNQVFGNENIHIWTMYKHSQSVFGTIDTGIGMNEESVHRLFIFDESTKDQSLGLFGRKGRGKGKLFVDANALFVLITKTADMDCYIAIISTDIRTMVGQDRVEYNIFDDISKVSSIVEQNLFSAGYTKPKDRQLLSKMFELYSQQDSGTFILVASDSTSLGPDAEWNPPTMHQKGFCRYDDCWNQNDERKFATGHLADRNIYTKHFAALRYLAPLLSSIYHAEKLDKPALIEALNKITMDSPHMKKKCETFILSQLEAKANVYWYNSNNIRGHHIKIGYNVSEHDILLGPCPFVTDKYDEIGTCSVIFNNCVTNWKKENEPLGPSNATQRCGITDKEMQGILLQTNGTKKGKLSKEHVHLFIESLPNFDEKDNLQLLLDENGSYYVFILNLDLPQVDVPANSERCSYSDQHFNDFIESENYSHARSSLSKIITSQLQNETIQNTIKMVSKKKYSSKEQKEADAEKFQKKRWISLHNSKKYRLLCRCLDNPCSAWLHQQSWNIATTERELETDYFIFESMLHEFVFEGKFTFPANEQLFWFRSMKAPGYGNDRMTYNRFVNPGLCNSILENKINFTNRSVNQVFREIEFKVQLRNGATINHPFENMHCIIVTELPIGLTKLFDNKGFQAEVKPEHCFPTHLILDNIHKIDNDNVFRLGGGINNNVIYIIGFMNLLRSTFSEIADIIEVIPSQIKESEDGPRSTKIQRTMSKHAKKRIKD